MNTNCTPGFPFLWRKCRPRSNFPLLLLKCTRDFHLLWRVQVYTWFSFVMTKVYTWFSFVMTKVYTWFSFVMTKVYTWFSFVMASTSVHPIFHCYGESKCTPDFPLLWRVQVYTWFPLLWRVQVYAWFFFVMTNVYTWFSFVMTGPSVHLISLFYDGTVLLVPGITIYDPAIYTSVL